MAFEDTWNIDAERRQFAFRTPWDSKPGALDIEFSRDEYS
jgi:hypothetical protein